MLFEFNQSLLRESNEILLRVKAASYLQGLLDEIYIGPSSAIQPYYLWKKIIRVDLVYWTSAGMLLLAMVVFLFWVARKTDIIYLIFSAELVIWSVHNLNLFVSRIPVSSKLWEALMMTTLGWTVVLMMLFNHRYLGDKKPTLEKVALLFACLGFGIFFMPSIESILIVGYRYWDSILVVIGCYCVGYLVYKYWSSPHTHVSLMLVVGLPMLVFGFHDILLVNNLRPRSEGLIIQYSAMPAVVVFTWFLVSRFVNSLNIAEDLSANLEQKVKQKEIELSQQFKEFQKLESEKILAQERERIMRDMHDGIGGNLISMATQLEGNVDVTLVSVRERILQSITDLRLVIDSLDPMLNDMNTLLGTVRLRLSGMLDSAGIELQWAIQDLPEEFYLGPKHSLHLMRIIQECVTNAIKHSGTTQLRVSSGVDSQGGAFVEVQDFGCGFTEASKSDSRGLKNMRHRAFEIGAQLRVVSDQNGSRVGCYFGS